MHHGRDGSRICRSDGRPVRPGRPLPQKEGENDMPPIDPTKRIAKWNAKYNLDRVTGTLTDLRPSMYASVQAVFPLITAMELQVKQVLD
ncbi:MAG: hypothetical protein ABIL25_01495, partial [candidate division WOR-3 bacterium]